MAGNIGQLTARDEKSLGFRVITHSCEPSCAFEFLGRGTPLTLVASLGIQGYTNVEKVMERIGELGELPIKNLRGEIGRVGFFFE